MNKFKILDENFEKRVKDSFEQQGFMSFIGAELLKVEAGYCEIRVPYSANLSQQNGFFHAGIVTTIADNAAGYAAYSLMESDSAILTVELKINFVAPAKGEYLIAKARVIKQGKTLVVCQAEVFPEDKNDICAATQTTLIELRKRED